MEYVLIKSHCCFLRGREEEGASGLRRVPQKKHPIFVIFFWFFHSGARMSSVNSNSSLRSTTGGQGNPNFGFTKEGTFTIEKSGSPSSGSYEQRSKFTNKNVRNSSAKKSSPKSFGKTGAGGGSRKPPARLSPLSNSGNIYYVNHQTVD